MIAISVMGREKLSLEMVTGMKECMRMEKEMDMEYTGNDF